LATLIYGKNPVKEALSNDRKIYEIYVVDKNTPSFLDVFKDKNLKITSVTKQKMTSMFSSTHQGIGALVDDYEPITLDAALKKQGPKLYIMLDSIEDPHNLGAIIRTADAFNISGIIIPKRRSVQITPTVVKVSTGAIEYVDVIQVTNLNQSIKTLKENNVWVVGTDASAQDDIGHIKADTDLCIVMGSEGQGISRLVKDNCDYLVKIPMFGHVNSLNVSVSTAIIIHDIIRRR
jgi:23S rRNA (guanosine2251-2'-O)-methyltransferase